jgi:succinate dehydrogenase/fumarate reductase flavoprotein subunit
MTIRNRTRIANSEWADAIDVMNMLDVCELIVRSSIERQESRGPFIRRDFPMTDNENWLAANVMHRGNNGPRFERRPYQLPFFAPDFVRQDNLDVPW